MAQSWVIAHVQEIDTLSPSNAFVTVVEVSFLMEDGTAGKVQLPVQGFSPEKAKEAIQAKVNAYSILKSMGG